MPPGRAAVALLHFAPGAELGHDAQVAWIDPAGVERRSARVSVPPFGLFGSDELPGPLASGLWRVRATVAGFAWEAELFAGDWGAPNNAITADKWSKPVPLLPAKSNKPKSSKYDATVIPIVLLATAFVKKLR